MKTSTILIGLFLVSASLLPAASEASKMELRADTMTQKGAITTAKGSAVAIIGDVRVSAAEITFDRNTGTLKCLGEVTIKLPERTLKATNATIDTSQKIKKIGSDRMQVEF